MITALGIAFLFFAFLSLRAAWSSEDGLVGTIVAEGFTADEREMARAIFKRRILYNRVASFAFSLLAACCFYNWR